MCLKLYSPVADVDISTAVEPAAASKSTSSSALLPPSTSGYVPPTPANTYDNLVNGKQKSQPTTSSHNPGYVSANQYESLDPPAAKPYDHLAAPAAKPYDHLAAPVAKGKPVVAASTLPAAPFNASAWAASAMDDAPRGSKSGRAEENRNSESFGFDETCMLRWLFACLGLLDFFLVLQHPSRHRLLVSPTKAVWVFLPCKST